MTEADHVAAAKLLTIWNRRKKESPKEIIQTKLAETWGDKEITQGAVSQYLHGRIPLNLTAVLRFAQFLRCQPQEIRDDLPDLKQGTPGSLDAYAAEIFALWPRLDGATRQFLARTAAERARLPDSDPSSPPRKYVNPKTPRLRAPR